MARAKVLYPILWLKVSNKLFLDFSIVEFQDGKGKVIDKHGHRLLLKEQVQSKIFVAKYLGMSES